MTNIKQNKGFTLIELLTVLTIIAVLAAIAIPQYREIRKTAFDTKAKEDLINVSRAEETYYADNLVYKSCENDGCGIIPGLAGLSSGVNLKIIADETGFTGTASHSQGSGVTFMWDSLNGGLQ